MHLQPQARQSLCVNGHCPRLVGIAQPSCAAAVFLTERSSCGNCFKDCTAKKQVAEPELRAKGSSKSEAPTIAIQSRRFRGCFTERLLQLSSAEERSAEFSELSSA